MSFYDDASLVLIPSGVKTSKVYSQKPTDGTGDLTFTRASIATRVQSNGLIEKVRTNEIFQSETFGNASWGKSLVTITDNFDTAPNGTLTADRFVSAGGAFPQISQAVTVVSGTTYTASIYVKSDGTTQIAQVIIIGGNTVSFTPTSTWQRITTTFTAASSSAAFVMATNLALAPASSFVIWGAQLETSDIATGYIPTTTAAVTVGPTNNVPRLDYLGSNCPRLLLEPQRTNLVLRSESFDNASWFKLNGSTLTANTSVSPSGYQDADKFQASNLAFGGILRQLPTVTSGVAHTFSFFCKKDNWRYVGIRFNTSTAGGGTIVPTYDFDTNTFNAQGVTGVTLSSQLYTNGWVRLILTFTSTTTTGTCDICIVPSTGDTQTALAGTEAILVYAAQLEVGAFVSSYIPTTTAAVTRLADACNLTGISSLIGQTEGTLFCDTIINGNLNPILMQIINNTSSYTESIYIEYFRASNVIRANFYNAGVLQATFDAPAVIGTRYKIAAVYKANDFALYVNGVQIGTDNSGSVQSGLQDLFIGGLKGSSVQDYNGNTLNQALLFKTRLTNSQLTELTTL